MYAFNSLYNKETNKVLIMRKRNTNPNKGVHFEYALVAGYPKLVKNSQWVTQMKNEKNHTVPSSLHCAAFGYKYQQFFYLWW